MSKRIPITSIFLVFALLAVIWIGWNWLAVNTEIIKIGQHKVMNFFGLTETPTVQPESKQEVVSDYLSNMDRITNLSNELSEQIDKLRNEKSNIEPKLKEVQIAYLMYRQKGAAKETKFFKERISKFTKFNLRAESAINGAMEVLDNLNRELQRLEIDQSATVNESLLAKAEATIEFVKKSNMDDESGLDLNDLKE